MSGQAKRSRVRAAFRHREQVARLIASTMARGLCVQCDGLGKHPQSDSGDWDEQPDCDTCNGTGRAQEATAIGILAGDVTFDVAAARDLGERLVHEGEDALATWAVFLDWGESQGWHLRGRVACWSAWRQAWAESEHARVWVDFIVPPGHAPAGGWIPGKRPRMDGAALVRIGRRLLAALGGQLSECIGCEGHGETGPGLAMNVSTRVRRAAVEGMRIIGEVVRGPCPACHGTGHNLAGALPPIEWPAVVRRKHDDSHEAGPDYPGRGSWASTVGIPLSFSITRSVPRGMHRALESMDMVKAIQRCARRPSVHDGRSLGLWSCASLPWQSPSGEGGRHSYEDRIARCPRWRRGDRWHLSRPPTVAN